MVHTPHGCTIHSNQQNQYFYEYCQPKKKTKNKSLSGYCPAFGILSIFWQVRQADRTTGLWFDKPALTVALPSVPSRPGTIATPDFNRETRGRVSGAAQDEIGRPGTEHPTSAIFFLLFFPLKPPQPFSLSGRIGWTFQAPKMRCEYFSVRMRGQQGGPQVSHVRTLLQRACQ